MNRAIIILSAISIIGLSFVSYPDGAIAALVVAFLSFFVVYIIRRGHHESDFLTQVFLIALIARLFFGVVIHIFDLRDFFGGDANTYDFLGTRLSEIWSGHITNTSDWWSQHAMRTSGPGWGMNYLIGSIYYLFGQNILMAQSFCAIFGAATAPLVYVCSFKIFQNRRVGRISAILVALFPAFVIWTGQLLKDGLVIFLLVLTVTMVLQLQKRFSYLWVAILILALSGILTLRFYIFYMIVIAVVASLIIGLQGSVKTIFRGIGAVFIIGLALVYAGVLQSAAGDFDKFGSLEMVQRSRLDLERSGESGFGAYLDVSTARGALEAIPVGFAYLMFAPFPWEMSSFRQFITLPDVILWWGLLPLLASGLIYTLKHRLRQAVAILIFTLMLTISYSVFQGNVGTAYRQRAQIQVFLFMFIAAGWTLFRERKENKAIMEKAYDARIIRKTIGLNSEERN